MCVGWVGRKICSVGRSVGSVGSPRDRDPCDFGSLVFLEFLIVEVGLECADSSAPSGRFCFIVLSTGCATPLASLHPWLQACAPSGRGKRSRCRNFLEVGRLGGWEVGKWASE